MCFDADRLTLWRVGYRPSPRFLFTAHARRPETAQWPLGVVNGGDRSWADIALGLGAGERVDAGARTVRAY